MYPYLPDIGSPAFRRWLLKFIPNPQVLKMQQITDILWQKSTEVYQAKKLALEQGDEAVTRQLGEGKDIMSILRTFTMPRCGNIAVVTAVAHGRLCCSSGKYERCRARQVARSRAHWADLVGLLTTYPSFESTDVVVVSQDHPLRRHGYHVERPFHDADASCRAPRRPGKAPQGSS